MLPARSEHGLAEVAHAPQLAGRFGEATPPAFVWYFRGSPHVHIWIHAADDPSTPISSYFG